MSTGLIQSCHINECGPVSYNLVIKMNAVLSHTILSYKWMQSCLMLVYATTFVLSYPLSLCNITLDRLKKVRIVQGNVCSKISGIVFSKILSIQNHTPTLPKSYSDFTKRGII